MTVNSLYTENSEDTDEMQQMQHNAAFNQGLHYLLGLKQPSGTEIHQNSEKYICDPLKYTMTIPYLLYQCVWENPSEYKGLKAWGTDFIH